MAYHLLIEEKTDDVTFSFKNGCADGGLTITGESVNGKPGFIRLSVPSSVRLKKFLDLLYPYIDSAGARQAYIEELRRRLREYEDPAE